MNITSDLIKSILTQSEAISCKNLRTEADAGDIIIRFEDDTDTTISIYYTPSIDLISIGTINSQGAYRNRVRIRHASLIDPSLLREYITLVLVTLDLAVELYDGDLGRYKHDCS